MAGSGPSRSRSHSSHPAHSHSTHSHSTTQFEWGNEISGELTPSGSPAYHSPSGSHTQSHPLSDDFPVDVGRADLSFDGFLPMDEPHDASNPSEESSMPLHSSYGSSPRTMLSSPSPPVADSSPMFPRGAILRHTRRKQVVMPGQLPDRLRAQEGPSSYTSPSPLGAPVTNPHYPRFYPVDEHYRWEGGWNPNGAGPSRPAYGNHNGAGPSRPAYGSPAPRLTPEDNRVIRDVIQSMQTPPTPRLNPAEYETLMSDLRGLTQEARDQVHRLTQVASTVQGYTPPSALVPVDTPETTEDYDGMGLIISAMGILVGLVLLKMFFDLF